MAKGDNTAEKYSISKRRLVEKIKHLEEVIQNKEQIIAVKNQRILYLEEALKLRRNRLRITWPFKKK